MKEHWVREDDLFDIFPVYNAPREKDNIGWKRVILVSGVEAELAKKDDEYRIVDMTRRKLIIQEQIKDAMIAQLRKGIKAVEELINESSGVDGLHLNGDTASWDELRTGGRFERWLKDFDETLGSENQRNEIVKSALSKRDKDCKLALEIFNKTHEPALKIYMEACDEANKICNEAIDLV